MLGLLDVCGLLVFERFPASFLYNSGFQDKKLSESDGVGQLSSRDDLSCQALENVTTTGSGRELYGDCTYVYMILYDDYYIKLEYIDKIGA